MISCFLLDNILPCFLFIPGRIHSPTGVGRFFGSGTYHVCAHAKPPYLSPAHAFDGNLVFLGFLMSGVSE